MVVPTYTISAAFNSKNPICVVVPHRDIEVHAPLHSKGYILLVGRNVMVDSGVQLQSDESIIRIVAKHFKRGSGIQLIAPNQDGQEFFQDFTHHAKEWDTGVQISPELSYDFRMEMDPSPMPMPRLVQGMLPYPRRAFSGQG